MGKRRIKPAKRKRQNAIRAYPPRIPAHLAFCFKYLEPSHEFFRLRDCEAVWLRGFIKRLKELSSLTVEEIVGNRSRTLRYHPISWADTNAREGFRCLRNPQLRDMEPCQLSLGGNAGRIHGFFLDDKFFVVWLDPTHALYS